jgi:hypothetical protein
MKSDEPHRLTLSTNGPLNKDSPIPELVLRENLHKTLRSGSKNNGFNHRSSFNATLLKPSLTIPVELF